MTGITKSIFCQIIVTMTYIDSQFISTLKVGVYLYVRFNETVSGAKV